MSTYGLTTAAHNRFDEAMGYLNNAERIAPEDQTVAKAQKELPRLQANWYNYLGKQSWDLAQKLYNIHFQSEVRRTAFTPGANAKQDTQEHAIKAMDYYLTAANFAPDDLTILENIAMCAAFYDVITWGSNVQYWLKQLGMAKAVPDTEKELLELLNEREKKQAEVERLKREGGLFSSSRIKRIEDTIIELNTEIDECYEELDFRLENYQERQIRVRALVSKLKNTIDDQRLK